MKFIFTSRVNIHVENYKKKSEKIKIHFSYKKKRKTANKQKIITTKLKHL